jgi:ankyrin repeat protein
MRTLAALICILALSAAHLAAQAPPSLTPSELALHQAAYAGKLDEVRRLVSEGTSVDATDPESHTPLMWAAFNGHRAVVDLLLEKGAEVDAKDESGRTALLYASSGSFAETVELLLKKGAAVNTQGTLEGFTALMTAAAEGQVKVVRLLLAHGADPALKDADGDTAESFALQKGHSDVVELLRNPPSVVERP